MEYITVLTKVQLETGHNRRHAKKGRAQQGRLTSQGAGELHAVILQQRTTTLKKKAGLSNRKPTHQTP